MAGKWPISAYGVAIRRNGQKKSQWRNKLAMKISMASLSKSMKTISVAAYQAAT